MTIYSLVLYVAIVALILTGLMRWRKVEMPSMLTSFLQNFCGALFIFSGWVKAIDPMGTGFKMQQYFAEFESTANGSFLKFLAPIFPWMSEYALAFSIIMIVLEIVLGVMLIIGAYRKLGSWLFFLIIVFFTVLTGFTFLTGYVPSGKNFFDFSSWVAYNTNNMKVTDCGCFGDFLKLEPKVSFMKDLFLLIPAIYFLFSWKSEHQLFSDSMRKIITILATVACILFCVSNYKWNEPMIDFRPFSIGTNIRTEKEKQKQAASEVKLLAYKMTNKQTGKVVELSYENFMKEFKSYPKEEWEYVQIKSEPTIESNKISDFNISSLDGSDVTNEILNNKEFSLLVFSYKVPSKATSTEVEVIDTLYAIDTIVTFDGKVEDVKIVKSVSGTEKKMVKKNAFTFDPRFIDNLKSKISPLIMPMVGRSVKTIAIVGGTGEEAIAALKEQSGMDIPFYTCDDLVIKTVMRSNPGVVLLKDGKIYAKWHIKQLPDSKTIIADYLDNAGIDNIVR